MRAPIFKNGKNFLVFTLLLCFASCGEVGTAYEQINISYTVSQRISLLNKTVEEVKALENVDALFIERATYLEYEYPIREDESYVISYRFRNGHCFKIGVDTYLNKERGAKNVANGIIQLVESDARFTLSKKEFSTYLWLDKKNKACIELNIQHIERGTINLTIYGSN